MAVNYPNLPGVEVQIHDGGLVVPEDVLTESMLIIAPTPVTTAPVEPTFVRNIHDLEAKGFGGYLHGTGSSASVNQLAMAFKAAYDGGCRQIYVMALEGGTELEKFKKLYDNLFGILADFSVDHIVIYGAHANVETGAVVEGDYTLQEDKDKYPNLPGLIGKETSDGAGGTITTYYGNFAKLLGDYTEMQTQNNNAVLGYIGTSAPASTSLTDIKAHLDALSAKSHEYSGNVSVIASPELTYRVPGRATLYTMNAAATYAALVSILAAQSAPTNKQVFGVAGLSYNVSLRQLNNLSGSKLVSFRVKNGTIVVTDGVTTAPDLDIAGEKHPSDFTRLSTVRIVQSAVNLIREVSDPFVGEPSRAPQFNALDAAIRGALESMKSANAITDFRFSIVSNGRQTVLGQAVVHLEIVPAFELRRVTVDVSLRPEIIEASEG